MALDIDNLRKEIEEENDFVQTVIDKIPPKIYFDGEILEYLEEQKIKLSDDFIREYSSGLQAGIHIKGRQKRARLNPNQHKTVSQIQKELLNVSEKSNKGRSSILDNSKHDNIEKLQEKLKNKLQQLQSNRNKNKINKKPKPTKAERRKEAKKRNKSNKAFSPEKKSAILNNPAVFSSKPVFNKEGNIVYSKFDLAENGIANNFVKKEGKKRIEKGNKVLKKSLKKVEIEKEKLKKLRAENPAKAEEVGELKLWQRAVKKAEGEKLKDDPDKIKATLKRKQKKKAGSRKKWKGIVEQTNKAIKDKQDKRQSNIKKKKQERKDKKIKQLKKKGRILPPGF